MNNWLALLHPRRYWLHKKFPKEIEHAASSLLPTPFDAAEIAFQSRLAQLEQKSVATEQGSSELISVADTGATDLRVNNQVRIDPENRDALTGAIEAAALYGMAIADKLAQIDTHIYDAMHNLSGAQIDNISDLSAALKQNWNYDAWSGLTEGGVRKLGGHLGETYVAEHLQQAGAQVQWAELSNQPGWDLILNGHEVNVKTIADTSQLHNHFSSYPDTPVIIPGDAANIPESALHFNPMHGLNDQIMSALDNHGQHLVLVDDALSHHDVMQHAADASDAALGSASMVDIHSIHLPWFTMATSGWREFKLLKEDKTDVASAIKNAGLDVAGRGVGGVAGAKAGALAGGIFGPIGAAVGAIAGAITGAVMGKKATDEIKRKPLEAALENYQKCKSQLEQGPTKLNRAAEHKFYQVKLAEQAQLNRLAREEKQKLNGMYLNLTKV